MFAMPERTVVLASTSPHRRALLGRLGLSHVAAAPTFDEIDQPGLTPLETAIAFAEGKARSVAALHARALVIGGDQTLELDGTLLRKPHGPSETVAQLERLAGRTHFLHAALAVLDTEHGRLATHVTTVTLSMRKLGRETLERYVDLDHPEGCVGGYTYEHRGVCLFDSVEGSDDSAIVGLPLVGLTSCFAELGVEILDLCSTPT